MKTTQPNILLIMTDQQRGDCLSIDGHPCLMTPNMDELAMSGMRFRRGYSTCPVCIPARRSLLSGQFPASHGMVGYQSGQEWTPPGTLPQILRDAGYQTALVGRSMHQHPRRKRFGYEEMCVTEDYAEFLEEHLPINLRHQPGVEHSSAYYSTGIAHNDWTAKPWPYDENLHASNWTIHEARRFLQRRDPSRPYFLTASFLAPHPPLIPPPFYFDRYMRVETPEPVIGDWAEPPAGHFAVSSGRVNLKGEALRSCRAGYYGLINHVDDQLRRLVYHLNGLPESDLDNTMILFVSDHGEMLGDHYLYGKRMPYEASARVPFLVRLPKSAKGVPRNETSDLPVCLEDVLPTCLDAAGLDVPDWVDGRSLMPILRGENNVSWREFLHIENGGGKQSFHALTDGREKFIWFSATGREQFFNLQDDPNECTDRIHSGEAAIKLWRERMVECLKARPEGFVEKGQLIAGRPHDKMIPAVGGS